MTALGERPGGGPAAALLWLVALLLMLSAATWQRLTGPTHPRRGRVELLGQDLRFRLPRSGTSGEPLLVAVPAPSPVEGLVHYRRYPTGETFRSLSMSREGASLVALLPTQPPAGKLEYYVTLVATGRELRIPERETIVMRFKGEVPALLLIPHVSVMFLAMMIGVRAALAALLGRPESVRYAWVTVVGIAVGGLVLGPIVQEHAFGAFWTGWPLGGDLTDNKTALMWLAWVAALLFARHRAAGDRLARTAIILAATVMLAVYVIPHSLRGSQLDYGKLGVPTPRHSPAIGVSTPDTFVPLPRIVLLPRVSSSPPDTRMPVELLVTVDPDKRAVVAPGRTSTPVSLCVIRQSSIVSSALRVSKAASARRPTLLPLRSDSRIEAVAPRLDIRPYWLSVMVTPSSAARTPASRLIPTTPPRTTERRTTRRPELSTIMPFVGKSAIVQSST
jgi:hypothetical protein